MNNKLKEELLYRVKLEPKFLHKINGKYKLDIEFYRNAVSYNIDSFNYIPDKYKEDIEIVNIILKTASTSNLKFPYNSLKISNNDQMKDLVKIKSIICYLKIYKMIYDDDIKFDREVVFSLMSENHPIISNIDCVLNCLNEVERNYIIFRYGLIDGCIKTVKEVQKFLGISYIKLCQLDKDSFAKMKKYVSSYGNITNRFK